MKPHNPNPSQIPCWIIALILALLAVFFILASGCGTPVKVGSLHPIILDPSINSAIIVDKTGKEAHVVGSLK